MKILTALLTVALASAAVATPTASFVQKLQDGQKQTIVTMGTSLTGGTWSWVTVMREWLDKDFPGLVMIHNLGVGASATERYTPGKSGLDVLPGAVALKPDVVFIEYSVNDSYLPYAISQEASRKNLNTMIDAFLAAKPDTEIIVQTMNVVLDTAAGPHASNRPKLAEYAEGHRAVAKERGLLLVDHYPNWLKLLNADQAEFLRLVPDGIHPQLPGYRQVLLPELKRALGAGGSP